MHKMIQQFAKWTSSHIEAETIYRRWFADEIFKCIFVNNDIWISISKILLKFVPRGPINNILALVQILA